MELFYRKNESNPVVNSFVQVASGLDFSLPDEKS